MPISPLLSPAPGPGPTTPPAEPGVPLARPVVDYEPAPLDEPRSAAAVCHAPPRRRPGPVGTPSPARGGGPGSGPITASRPAPGESRVPPGAAAFADAALRRLLEVADRRRPITQVRPMLAAAVYEELFSSDFTAAFAQPDRAPRAQPVTRPAPPDSPRPGPRAAQLRRVRLRAAGDRPGAAFEVFATYARAGRIRAVAGRIEWVGGRWQVVAVRIG